MKILMIGWGFPPKIHGGLDIHVHETCRELAKSNDVWLALPSFNCPDDPEGINIIPVRCPSGKSFIRTVKAYSAGIIKECSGMDFDVMHSHDWFGVEAAQKLRQKDKIPWVFTLHSLESMRGFSNGSLMERLEIRGAKKCDSLVTVSNFMRREIRKLGVKRRIEVVYNSANVGKAEPEVIRKRLGLGKRPVALFMGRLSEQKGIAYLMLSARDVCQKIPDARFIIAGEGHLKESLERFAFHLGMEDRISFPGFIPNEEIFSYYSAADVFVYPSLAEPFGISVLESLLSGTPVITTPSAGVLEKIPGMECVLKADPQDSAELSRKIIKALEERRRVLKSERLVIQKAYSWKNSAKQLAAIYQKLI